MEIIPGRAPGHIVGRLRGITSLQLVVIIQEDICVKQQQKRATFLLIEGSIETIKLFGDLIYSL